MTLRAKALSGLKWQGIEIGGRQLLSLAIFTLLARLLQPTDFGLLAMVAVYLAIASVVVDIGLGTAIVQRKDLNSEHLSSAFWFNVGCSGLLVAASVAAAGWIAQLFSEPRLVPLLQWGSLTLIAAALSNVHAALLLREMDFRRPAIRTLIANVAGGVVGVSMALGGYGVWSLVGQQMAASVVGTLFLWRVCSWRPRWQFSIGHLKELAGVSGSVFAAGVLWLIASRADQFFVGRVLGTALLGQYVVGGKLIEVTRSAIQQPLGRIALPAFSSIQTDMPRLRRAVVEAVHFTALVACPVFLGLAVIAPTLVPLVFGPGWEKAVVAMQCLAVYQLLCTLLAYPHPTLVALSAIRGYTVVNVGCAAGAIIACSIGVRFGLAAVVAGLIVNIILTGIASLIYLWKASGLTPWHYVRPAIPALSASCLMVIAVLAMQSALPAAMPLIVAAASQALVGVLVYAGAIMIVDRGIMHRAWQLVRSRATFPSLVPTTETGD